MINYLLTYMYCLSRTGEYWPLVIIVHVWTPLGLFCTALTLDQNFPVQPLYSERVYYFLGPR